MDVEAFQTCLEEKLPGIHAVNDEQSIDKCIRLLTSAIHKVTAASATKCRPRTDNLRPPLHASIQDEIHQKKQLRRQWQVMRDPALKAQSTASGGR
jgi:hypothetical protein